MQLAGHKWQINKQGLEESWCDVDAMRKTIVLIP
jgi:hypothetical protein